MSFPWDDHMPRGPSPDKFREQHVRGIRERARLLYNLKFTEAQATRRIRAALEWEFDDSFATTPHPAFFGEIGDIVASVFAHARRGQAPAKTPKGKRTGKGRRKRA